MGCVLCNLIHLSEEQEPFPSDSARQHFMNELAGDIAQYHPELVEKINECCRRAQKLTWQQGWPDKPGAWWFYGVMKREKQPALFVLSVHATKNEPPVYIAAWQQEIMQPGEITGWFRWIPTPEMPDGIKVDVW